MDIDNLIKDQNLFNSSYSGIYLISCPNGCMYIGQSVNIKKRWREHMNYLKNNKHKNPRLQNIFNKYGVVNYFILENCDKSFLNERESFWAAKIDREKLLNYASIGEYVQRSKEMKEKFSEMLRKRNTDPEFIEKVKKSLKGMKRSEETKQKIREARKLQAPASQETRRKLSLASKAAYARNYEKRYEINKALALKNIEKNTKIKPEQYEEIFKLLAEGKSTAQIAKIFEVSKGAINNVRYRRRKEFK